MRHTRNVIVLKGNDDDIHLLLGQLRFTGIQIIRNMEDATQENIEDILEKNKSVICIGDVPERLKKDAIEILVVNGKEKGNKELSINVAGFNVIKQFKDIANMMNWDIGEFVFDESENEKYNFVEDCFCCEFIKKSDYEGLTIYKSDNFIVLPALGEFALGYLMIVPYKHIASFANLKFDERLEILKVLEDVKTIIKMTYGINKFMIWEDGKKGDSIVHAHLHIAPSTKTDINKVEKELKTKLENVDYDELDKYSEHSYLIVENKGNWKIKSDPNFYIPKQFIRKLLASEYGCEEGKWNWMNYPFLNNVQKTVEDIRRTMIRKYSSLSKRIRECVNVLIK